MFVYVINKHGKPLMPCKPQKARKLLTAGKAKVVNHEPFTIQLLFGSSGYRQSVTLGIDAGSVHIGASASTKKQELYASEKVMRSGDGKATIVRLLAKRRELRHSRRNRKTRYRKPRFLNRVHHKQKGWLAPSVENKIHVHRQSILFEALHLMILSLPKENVGIFEGFVLKKLDGTKLEIMPSKISFGWHNKSYLVERRSAAPLAVKTASTRRANY